MTTAGLQKIQDALESIALLGNANFWQREEQEDDEPPDPISVYIHCKNIKNGATEYPYVRTIISTIEIVVSFVENTKQPTEFDPDYVDQMKLSIFAAVNSAVMLTNANQTCEIPNIIITTFVDFEMDYKPENIIDNPDLPRYRVKEAWEINTYNA